MASSINLTGSSVLDTPLESTAVQHEEVVLGHNAWDQMQQPFDSSRHLTGEARRDRRITDAAAKSRVLNRRRHQASRFCERPDVRRVDAAANDGGGLDLVPRDAGGIHPPLDLLESMEMEEDERLLINPHTIASFPNRLVRKFPGREVSALVL